MAYAVDDGACGRVVAPHIAGDGAIMAMMRALGAAGAVDLLTPSVPVGEKMIGMKDVMSPRLEQ